MVRHLCAPWGNQEWAWGTLPPCDEEAYFFWNEIKWECKWNVLTLESSCRGTQWDWTHLNATLRCCEEDSMCPSHWQVWAHHEGSSSRWSFHRNANSNLGKYQCPLDVHAHHPQRKLINQEERLDIKSKSRRRCKERSPMIAQVMMRLIMWVLLSWWEKPPRWWKAQQEQCQVWWQEEEVLHK